MTYIFRYLLIQVCLVSVLFSQWEEQNSGTTVTLNDICFTDSLNGFAFGEAIIIHTSDGGKNWSRQNFSPSQDIYITAYTGINAYNKDIASFVGDSAFIYYTTNGGADWIASNTGYPYHYFFSHYFNDSTLYITGTIFQEAYGGAIILKSTNYGADWEKIFLTKYGVDTIPYWIDDLFFTSADTGYAIFHISFDNFGPNDFMRTVDGGKSWSKIGSIPHMVLDLERSYNLIWARGFGFDYSTDLGANWKIFHIANWAINDMAITGDNSGYFLVFNQSSEPPIFRYADLTANLIEEISVPDGFIPLSLSFVNERNIWLSGTNGKIYNYNPTLTGINYVDKVYSFSLYQNYPNPFNPVTKIKYTIPGFVLPPSPYQGEGQRVRSVTLKVYDILGNEIATLVNREQSPGEYEIDFDGSKLSSGIYFYVLNKDGNILSKKMCLLK